MEKNIQDTVTGSEVKYCVKEIDRTGDSTKIELPSDSDLSLESGDVVHQELQDWGITRFIQGRETDELPSPMDGNYKVHGDYNIVLPERWEFPSDDLSQLLFEFPIDDEWEFRLYDPMDFAKYRVPELKREGKNITQGEPLFALLASECIDIETWKKDNIDFQMASKKAYWLFKIIPFNAKKIDEKKLLSNNRFVLDRKNRLPQCQVGKISVIWDPAGSKHPSIDRRQTLYTETNVEEAKIRLPAMGSFQISTDTSQKTVWINHDDGDSFGTPEHWNVTKIGKWEGKYLKDEGDHIEVYVPCNPK